MTTMTDSKAVEIVADAISNEAYEKAQPALQHIAARLREPAGVGAVFNCLTCPVSVQGQWQAPECPECGERCYVDATAKPSAAHPPAEAQAQGGGEVVGWLRHRPDGTPDWSEDCLGTDTHFLDHELKSDGYTLRPLIYGDTAPPSAPVGVEG